VPSFMRDLWHPLRCRGTGRQLAGIDASNHPSLLSAASTGDRLPLPNHSRPEPAANPRAPVSAAFDIVRRQGTVRP